ncbi:MAG: T9SS type A sorting domain-containing protein, partial [Bacteroidetes bacterium]|nr:T9SS type A sorting domain-containing protein [Bacteroidota bacterium]MBU1679262.1 T9SS type A sorting domain-containing protein [Bacteroidota bacterium]
PGFLDSDNFYYQPNSDSTFLAIINKERQIGDFHHLLQVNINTLFIDTLYSVQVEDNKQMLLSAFAYNAAKELLAINISYNWQSTLYIYDYSDSVKNLIYSSELFDNEPALMITEYMEWSPENDKLILLGYPVTGFGCAADLFKLEDTTRVELWHSGTFNAPEPYYSEHLWYDNEIIIYRGKGSIYSYNIDKETSLDEHEINLVPEFLALKNYPNPFNQSTVISYQLPSFSQVKLSIYDLLGREVAELMNEQKPAGKYKVIFNANNFSSGVYIYRLTTDNQSISKKMLLTK